MDEYKMFVQPQVESENVENKKEKFAIKNLYKGVWADQLENGQLLPVGGSIFRPDLHLSLDLDFETFEEQLKSATPARLEEAYVSTGEEKILEYLRQLKADIDPRLFYACLQVQRKVNDLLKAGTGEPESNFERSKRFEEEKSPKLSEFVGISQCAERAALGQYVMQKLEVGSSYMSGIVMEDPADIDECPENHSFLVVKKDGKTYVHDIARPHQGEIPRLFEMQKDMNSEDFANVRDLLLKGEDIFTHHKMWFGVGDAAYGKHTKYIEEVI